jgi:diguanylate cyclase (GGDEF)-like protein
MRRDPVLLPLGVLGAVSLTGFILGGADHPAKVAMFWIMNIAVHTVFIANSWRVARLRPGGDSEWAGATRRLWLLCTFSGAAFVAGDILQLVEGIQDPYADTATLGGNGYAAMIGIGAVALLIGLLWFPLGEMSKDALSRLRLDVATVMAAAVTIGMTVFQLPAGNPGLVWVLNLLLAVLVQPGIFLVLIFAIVKLVLGGRAPFTRTAGMICGAAAIMQGGLQSVPLAHYASIHDSPWLMAGQLLASTLLAFGTRIQEVQVRADPRGLALKPRRPYSVLPYVAMTATWALTLATLAGAGLDWHVWVVGGGAMATTALVVGRQITAFKHIAELLEERDALAARLTELAFHDGLTGLPNRALFMKKLEAGLAEGPVTVFLIDLDDFKPVNDDFGHATGDELLVEVGRRLRSCVRENDTVARLGGDEFAVLINGIEVDRRQELAAALHGRVTLGAAEVRLSASIGVAHGRDGADSLLHTADMQMYAEKRSLNPV